MAGKTQSSNISKRGTKENNKNKGNHLEYGEKNDNDEQGK